METLPSQNDYIRGSSLAEDVLKQLGTTGDIQERVIVSMAEEVDRLGDILLLMGQNRAASSSTKAQVVTRRVQALKVLNEALAERGKRKDPRLMEMLATMLRTMRQVLQENKQSPEMIETVLQSIMKRVEEKDTEREANLATTSAA